jgi:chromosome segregation ATPase
MTAEGFSQLSAYVRSEMGRLRALTDFDAALTLLETYAETKQGMEKTIAKLRKETEQAAEEARIGKERAAADYDQFASGLEETRKAASKKHAKAMEEAEAQHTAELEAIATQKKIAKKQLDFIKAELKKTAVKHEDASTQLISLAAQKDEMLAAIASIKEKLGM